MLDASDLSCRLWPVWHRSARPFTQSTQTCRRHERRCYCMIEKVQLPVLCSVGSNENENIYIYIYNYAYDIIYIYNIYIYNIYVPVARVRGSLEVKLPTYSKVGGSSVRREKIRCAMSQNMSEPKGCECLADMCFANSCAFSWCGAPAESKRELGRAGVCGGLVAKDLPQHAVAVRKSSLKNERLGRAEPGSHWRGGY